MVATNDILFRDKKPWRGCCKKTFLGLGREEVVDTQQLVTNGTF